MSRSLLRFALSLACCCLLTGCPARWILNVRNATDSNVTMMIGEFSEKQFAVAAIPAVLVPPGDTGRLPVGGSISGKKELLIYSSSGKLVARGDAMQLLQLAAGDLSKYPDARLLLSKKGLSADTLLALKGAVGQ